MRSFWNLRSIEPMKVGDRVRILRERRGWTQAELADNTGSISCRRSYVAKVEIGLNQLSSYELRHALAHGFGLSPEEFDAYLDGRISVDEAARRGEETEGDPLALLGYGADVPTRPVPPAPPAPALPALDAEKEWQGTLWKVARKCCDDPKDYVDLLRALPKTFQPKAWGFAPEAVAEGLFRSVRSLRERSVPITFETLLAESASRLR